MARRQLKIPATLFGRTQETETLESAYRQCQEDEKGSSVVIYGVGGSGKSSLVREFATRHELFCEGKFNMNRASEPFSAIVDAFEMLFCDKLASTSEGRQELSDALEKVALDESILRQILPRLYQVVDDHHAKEDNRRQSPLSNSGHLENNESRLHSAFFNLLRFVCKPSRPVVMFLDDWQWSDQCSVDFVFNSLIERLDELQGLLLVMAFRNDEVNDDHAFSVALTKRNSKNGALPVDVSNHETNHHQSSVDTFTEIHLTGLDLEMTNTLVAESLERKPSDTMPLAQVLFSKTNGNPFYLVQSLQLLERGGLLSFSTSSYTWEWADVEQVRLEMGISDNVVDLVASSMRQLPRQTQEVLMIASFLGGQFRANVIAEYFQRYSRCTERECTADIDTRGEEKGETFTGFLGNEDVVDKALEAALDMDFLARRSSSSTYSWSHDRLQQAAYSLIADGEERNIIHLHLGMTLKELYATQSDEQWMLFVAAEQLSRGSCMMTDANDRIDLARLNLEASKLASSKSALIPAAKLLRKGVDLVDPALRWSDDTYELCVELFTSLAKLEYVLGNLEACQCAINEVLANGKSLDDKFKAHNILIDALAARRELDELFLSASQILRQYGVKIQVDPNRAKVQLAEYRFKRKYERLGIGGILQLPPMNDSLAMQQMDLLFKVSAYAISYGKRNLGCLGAIRAIEISFSKGKNSRLPACFCSYGMYLGLSGRDDEAYEFAQVGVKTFESFGEPSMIARINPALHGTMIPLRRPFHESLEANMEAYRVAAGYGDLEFALTSALWYCVFYAIVGLPLNPVLSDLEKFIDQVRIYQLPQTLLLSFQIQLQMILNLQEGGDDATILTGDAMEQQVALESFEGRSLWSTRRDICTARIQLAYIFGNLEVGREMVDVLKEYPDDLVVARKYLRDTYSALMCFALAREQGDKKSLARGRKLLKLFQQKTKEGSMNAHPIYVFLLAEDGAIRNSKKDADSVKLLYDDAIKTLSRSGLIHLAAMANERAGQMFLGLGDEATATFYLSRSLDLYDDWRAAGKVSQMRERYGKYVADAKGASRSIGLKARSRLSVQGSPQFETFDLDLSGSKRSR